MRHKTVSVECVPDLAHRLAEAVRAYAHAAYPPGGSECAQSVREALLDTASLCDDHPGGGLTLRRRQMAQLRAAVAWYFQESGSDQAEVGGQLATLLSAKR